jgi:hypothetical protein
MRSNIYNNEGSPLDSHFLIKRVTDNEWQITIESRGGKIGSSNSRNADYSKGFQLLLQRLGKIGAILDDAFVDSQKMQNRGLSPGELRLDKTGVAFPKILTSSNAKDTALLLMRSEADIGSEKKKITGGNITRRVSLRIKIPSSFPPQDSFSDFIMGATSVGRVEEEDIQVAVDELDQDGEFDPRNVADARERILTTIARRRGQPKFRSNLLKAYNNKCAITGCNAVDVLEAAHILAYRGEDTNHVQNGILLRADLHTLFDRGLVGIDPDSWKIILHESLRRSDYRCLDGKPLRLPAKTKRPNSDALKDHLQRNGLV